MLNTPTGLDFVFQGKEGGAMCLYGTASCVSALISETFGFKPVELFTYEVNNEIEAVWRSQDGSSLKLSQGIHASKTIKEITNKLNRSQELQVNSCEAPPRRL